MKEKTLEEQLEEAESEVEEAEADLDDARDTLRRAERRRDFLQRKIDARALEGEAAFIAAQTGPRRPIGDRVVRHSCALSEIPEWFGAMWGYSLRCLVGDRKYAMNGHVMIDVDSVEGLEVIPHDPAQMVGRRSAPLDRRDAPIECGDTVCRDFGSACASLKYTTLIEDLFPGVEWRATGGALDPLYAVVDGHVVAVVMPVRGDVAGAA